MINFDHIRYWKGSCKSMNSGRFKTIHESINYHHEADPGALCCSLRAGGVWRPISRGEFQRHMLSWAVIFREGLAPGSLILFLKRPDIHLLAAYIGAMHAG